jgi:hypothetical protein
MQGERAVVEKQRYGEGQCVQTKERAVVEKQRCGEG